MFLQARLDEDAAVAQAAAVLWDDGNWTEVEADPYAHAQHHNPARALREVAAKWAILNVHRQLAGPRGVRCIVEQERWPCATVWPIATVYRDHPDYDPAWTSG
jgi:hypothetical protein